MACKVCCKRDRILWTTPTDLAKFLIEMALSKHGKSNRVLSQSMAQQMLTPQIDVGDGIGNMGLGFFLYKKNPQQFAHGGEAWAFQAIVLMLGDDGKGAVVMTNADNGFYVADRLVTSIAHEYGWKYYDLGRQYPSLPLVFIAMARGADAAIQKYRDLKASSSPDYRLGEDTLDDAGHALLKNDKTQDAIAILKANVQEYPKSASVYDSLGEAYSHSGQKNLAIETYQKALKLDPHDQNAAEALRKLRGN